MGAEDRNPRLKEAWVKFEEAYPGSKWGLKRARRLMPGGFSHNYRIAHPFPLYIERGEGPYKWDIDGNRYLDYGMASASLLLGHRDPAVVEALTSQLPLGTGATACNETELEWAELVNQLIPSAERVRFTGSGTEATLLALRLARAYTSKPKIVRIQGHYHGWHDYMMLGHREPFDRPASAGIPSEVLGQMLIASLNNTVEDLRELLSRDDVAGVILEPTGASWGSSPLPDGFIHSVRELTKESGAVLIFDEVVTGFRVSPGGVQGKEQVIPELTALGKILAGGLPGGAVAGRADIMELLSPWEVHDDYVFHYGTFNANPISAVAGIATLLKVRTGEPNTLADSHAQELRSGLSELIAGLSVNGFAYGDSSLFHLYLEPAGGITSLRAPRDLKPTEFLAMQAQIIELLQIELRMRGVDILTYNGGVTSASHGPNELDHALDAFEGALRSVRDSGMISSL